MAEPATIDIEFLRASEDLMRYRVVLNFPEDVDVPEVVSAQRLPKNPAKPPTRLAFVEGPDKAFAEIAAAAAGSNVVNLELATRPRQVGLDVVRYVLFVEASVTHGAQLHVIHKLARAVATMIATTKNTAAPAKQVLTTGAFPRLIVGITQGLADCHEDHRPAEDPAGGKADELELLLRHIESRLRTRKSLAADELRIGTLEAAWRQQGGRALPRKPRSEAHVALAEEAWARQVTEMLLLTPYGGPGVHYSEGEQLKDHELIADGIDGSDTKDPRYAIIYACQHLASFGVASRGRQVHRFKYNEVIKARVLINAGSGSATTVQSIGGQWIVGGDPPKPFVPDPKKKVQAEALDCKDVLKTAKELYKIRDVQGCEFAAGAVFVFANRPPQEEGLDPATGLVTNIVGDHEITLQVSPNGAVALKTHWKVNGALLADNTAGAHAGFVLRTDLASPPKFEAFQTFDTGGLAAGGNRGEGITVIEAVKSFHSGNFDDPPTTSVKGTDPFRGVGVWKKMKDTDAQALDDHVEGVLKKARPLGFARLVVVDGNAKFKVHNLAQLLKAGKLLYASPLLRMYRDDPLQNYSIARFIWSLRATPCGTAKVMWWISIPRGPLARAMITCGRGAKIDEIVSKALNVLENKKSKGYPDIVKDPELTTAKVLSRYTLPLLDIEATDADRVKVTYKYPNIAKWHALHLAERFWGGKPLLPMDREYIKDGQSTASFPAYFKEF